MPSNTEVNALLYKNFRGVSNTNSNKSIDNEPFQSYKSLLTNQLWLDSSYIPTYGTSLNTVLSLTNNQIYSVIINNISYNIVQKCEYILLNNIVGSSNSLYSENLIGFIPGEFTITKDYKPSLFLRDNNGSYKQLNYNVNDLYIDNSSGVVTFYGNTDLNQYLQASGTINNIINTQHKTTNYINDENPTISNKHITTNINTNSNTNHLYISFWKYIGRTGDIIPSTINSVKPITIITLDDGGTGSNLLGQHGLFFNDGSPNTKCIDIIPINIKFNQGININNSSLSFNSTSGSLLNSSITNSNNILGTINFMSCNSVVNNIPSFLSNSYISSTTSNSYDIYTNNYGTYLSFYTTNDNSSTPKESLRLYNNSIRLYNSTFYSEINVDNVTQNQILKLGNISNGSMYISQNISQNNSNNSNIYDLNIGVLPIMFGGTNISSYVQGDILYATDSNTLSPLHIGYNNQILSISNNSPSWSDITDIIGTLQVSNGGTGISSYNIGDILYASSTTTLSTLSTPTTNSSNKILTTNSIYDSVTSSYYNIPFWTSYLYISQGGTGITSYINGDLIYYNSMNTTSFSQLHIGNNNQILSVINGYPNWSDITDIIGTLNVSNGGTGISSYNIGDILYASSPTTLSTLSTPTTPNPTTPSTSNKILTTNSIYDFVTSSYYNIPFWTSYLYTSQGGTGKTTYNSGDILYFDSVNPNSLTSLSIGSSNQLLSVISGLPKWNNISTILGTTNLTSGDIIYASGSNSFTNLTIGTNNQILISTGLIPKWTSTLDVSQGGTGLSSLLSGDILVANSTTSFSPLHIGSNYQILSVLNNDIKWVPKLLPLQGGTGINSYIVGDIIYANSNISSTSTNSLSVIHVGNNNQILSVLNGLPEWNDFSTIIGGVIPTNLGGTGITTYVPGDIIYIDFDNNFTRLSTNPYGQLQPNQPGLILSTISQFNSNTGVYNYFPNWQYYLKVEQGGTGLTTYNVGDILFANITWDGSIDLFSLPIGEPNQILNVINNLPKWSNISSVLGVIPITNGGTGISLYNVGDMIYANESEGFSIISMISNSILISDDYGIPSWINTLPVSQGGTGISSYVDGDLIYYNSTSLTTSLSKLHIGNNNQILSVTNGYPNWSDITDIIGTLQVSNGGTGISSYNIGDILYASNTTTLSTLPTPTNLNPTTPSTSNKILTTNSIYDSVTSSYYNIPSWTSYLYISQGGTGITSYINGDLIYYNSMNTTSLSKLHIGNNNQILSVINGYPNWSDITDIIGTLNVSNGGTGISAYTIGDILYASNTTTLSTLPIKSSGVLTVSNGVPQWLYYIDASQGGTGISRYELGDLLYGNSSNTLSSLTIGNNNQILSVTNGYPNWSDINDIIGTLSVLYGGTGISSYTTGDILYASDTTTLTKINMINNCILTSSDIGIPTWISTLPISRGGTGISNYVDGDLIYYNSMNTITSFSQLHIGNNNQILSVTNNIPNWSDITDIIGTLSVSHGGTGLSSYTTGDLLYGDITGSLSILPINSNQGYVLTIDNGLPAWRIPSILSEIIYPYQGGTGLTSFASGDMFYSDSTNPSTLTKLHIGNNNQILSVTNGYPNWSDITDIIGTLQVSHGGTGISFYTTGDLLYASDTTTLTKINMINNCILTSSNIGVPTWISTLPISRGGTGISNYVDGDLIYYNSINTTTSFSQLHIGNNNQILSVTNNIPNWSDITDIIGTLSVSHGGTGIYSYNIGDILYASSSTTLSTLQTTNNGILTTSDSGDIRWSFYLTTSLGGTGITSYSQGDIVYGNLDGNLSKLPIINNRILSSLNNIPHWSNLTDIIGTLQVSHGGTGISSYTTGDLLYASDTTTLTTTHMINNSILTSSDIGVPTWISTLPISRGGTGISSYTDGDLIYYNSMNTITSFSQLHIGNNNQILSVINGYPNWSDITDIIGTLSVSHGGTGMYSYTTGDILYASDTTTLSTTHMINNCILTSSSVGVPTWISTLPISRGGTGISNYTDGDLIYYNSNYLTTLSQLHIGNNDQILSVTNGYPNWSDITDIIGTLSVSHGGTGISSYTTGDILYASNTTTLTKINMINNCILTSSDIGVPTWINTLPISRGGTGISTYVDGDLIYYNSMNTTTSFSQLHIGNNNQILSISNGYPSWSDITTIIGTLSVSSGGTGINTYTIGDLLYADSTNSLNTLSITSSDKILISKNSYNPISSTYNIIPSWTSYLTTTQGGTGMTTYIKGDIIYAVNTNELSAIHVGQVGEILTSLNGIPHWSSKINVSQGGTGITSYDTGDLLYGNIYGGLSKLIIGEDNQILISQTTSSGKLPKWVDISTIIEVIPPSSGGTGITSYTSGDLLYAYSSDTITKLPIGTNNQILISSTYIDQNTGLPIGIYPYWTSYITTLQGGTGITSYSSGDLIYSNSIDNLTNLPIGLSGQVLSVYNGLPKWRDTSIVIGTIPVIQGGTGITTYNIGDILYASSSDSMTKLHIGSSNNILISDGSSPYWTSTLYISQGGTGISSYTDGDLIYYNSTSLTTSLSKLHIGNNNQILSVTNGYPNWSDITTIIGTLSVSHGGTGIYSYTSGDILYASDTTTLTKINMINNCILTSSNIGVPTWINTLPIIRGGTGISSYTDGDLIYYNSMNTTSLSKLHIGNNNQILFVLNGYPNWSDITDIIGTLQVSNGGTGISAYTIGDILYASDTTTLTTIHMISNCILTSSSVGIPTWISTLPTSRGGTGITTFTSGGILYASDTSSLTTTNTGLANQILITDGTKPTWISSLTISQGGTGSTSFTNNSLLYSSSSNLSSLQLGTSGYVLISNGSSNPPSWVSGLSTIGTVPVSQGGTGIYSYTSGDILYALDTTTLTKINMINNCILTSSNIGVPTWISTLPIIRGGTGIYNYTDGDLIYYNSMNTTSLSKLHIGNNNQILSVTNGYPNWSDITTIIGTLPVSNGGTGISSYTIGDILYANTTSSLIPVNIISNSIFTSNSLGVPTWTSYLTTSQGGTGLTSFTSGGILYASSTSSLTTTSLGAANQLLMSDGTQPTWTSTLSLAQGGTGNPNLNTSPAGLIYKNNISDTFLSCSARPAISIDFSSNLSCGTTFTVYYFSAANPTNTLTNCISLVRSHAPYSTQSAVFATDILGTISFNGYGTGISLVTGAYITATATSKFTTATRGTYLSLYTTLDNLGTASPSETLRLQGSEIRLYNSTYYRGFVTPTTTSSYSFILPSAAASVGTLYVSSYSSGNPQLTLGILPTNCGGTNLSSFTSGGILYASDTTTLTTSTGTAGQILTHNGTNPTWSPSLTIAQGGTGTTSFTSSALVYASSTSALASLSVGTSGQVLISGGVGASPSWTNGINIIGTVPTTQGGTGLTSFTSGGILYASSTSALATSAGTSSGQILTYNGTNPTWSSSLTIAQGGTGTTSFTSSALVYASSTSVLASLSVGTSGQVLISGGVGVAPSWTNGINTIGTVPTTQGGTGLTAFTSGGILYASSTSALATSAGTINQILVNDGTKPTWTSSLTIAQGGTGSTSFTANSLVYASSTSSLSSASVGTSGQVLISGGSGSAPSWTNGINTIGTVPLSQGGTGISLSTSTPGLIYKTNTGDTTLTCSSTVPFKPDFYLGLMTESSVTINTYSLNSYNSLLFNRYRSTYPTTTAVSSLDVLGSVDFGGYNGTANVVGSSIRSTASEAYATNKGTYISLFTTATSSATLVETCRIQNNNIQIYNSTYYRGFVTPTTTSSYSFIFPSAAASVGALYVGTYSSGDAQLTLGLLPTNCGGTNLSSFTSGGILYASSTSALATSAGTINQILVNDGTKPTWTSSLTIAQGGTGTTSFTSSALLYASSTSTLASLSIGTSGQVLISGGVGAAPSWTNGINTIGTVPTTQGGTGLTAFTSGGILYASSTSALATSAGTINQILINDGTKPTWTSSLTVSQGGTGTTSFTSSALLYASSTSALASLSVGTSGQVLISGGVGASPSWTNGINTIGTVPTNQGGTGLTAFTSGGILYASSTSALATSTGTANQILIHNGTNPTWSSSLTIAQGGTGSTSFTANSLVYALSTTQLSGITIAGSGNILVGGTSPAWSSNPLINYVNIGDSSNTNSYLLSIKSVNGFSTSDSYSYITGKFIGTSSTTNTKSILTIDSNIAPSVNSNIISNLRLTPTVNIATSLTVSTYAALFVDSGTLTLNGTAALTKSYGLYVNSPFSSNYAGYFGGRIGVNNNTPTMYIDVTGQIRASTSGALNSYNSQMIVQSTTNNAEMSILFTNSAQASTTDWSIGSNISGNSGFVFNSGTSGITLGIDRNGAVGIGINGANNSTQLYLGNNSNCTYMMQYGALLNDGKFVCGTPGLTLRPLNSNGTINTFQIMPVVSPGIPASRVTSTLGYSINADANLDTTGSGTVTTWANYYSGGGGTYNASSGGTGTYVTYAYGLYINPPNFGTNSYAAYFGGGVGIGTLTPGYNLDVTGTFHCGNSNNHLIYNSLGFSIGPSSNSGSFFNVVCQNIYNSGSIYFNLNGSYGNYTGSTTIACFNINCTGYVQAAQSPFTGTATNYGMNIVANLNSTSAITLAKHCALNISPSSTTNVTVTTSYGLYVSPAGFGTTQVCARFDGSVGYGKDPNSSYLIDLNTDGARKLTTSSWATGSDMRIKKNIQEANYDICYDNIKNLSLMRFTWDEQLLPNLQDRTSIGWIAQDVEKVFPKAVSKSKDYGLDDFRTLNNDQINKCLYGCVKKLIQKIEEDEKQISELTNMVKLLISQRL
jgi:ketopantoate reductase